MEISIDNVNSRSDPYQLFLDSIRSPSTLRRYENLLYTFLKLIPNQIYTNSLGKTPNDREESTLAKFFVELARKDIDLASDVIATFIKEGKKRVTSGEISSQTLPNHIKPIKVLLDANRIPIHWKSLNKLLPRRESKSQDRAYTKEEIQKMLDISNDLTDKVIILMFSSGGFRLEAIGIISKTVKDALDVQRKVRNRITHNITNANVSEKQMRRCSNIVSKVFWNVYYDKKPFVGIK